jgi:ribosomal protein L37E
MVIDPPFPFNLVTSSRKQTPQHCECRKCGENLRLEREECPECGGPAVAYNW